MVNHLRPLNIEFTHLQTQSLSLSFVIIILIDFSLKVRTMNCIRYMVLLMALTDASVLDVTLPPHCLHLFIYLFFLHLQFAIPLFSQIISFPRCALRNTFDLVNQFAYVLSPILMFMTVISVYCEGNCLIVDKTLECRPENCCCYFIYCIFALLLELHKIGSSKHFLMGSKLSFYFDDTKSDNKFDH